MIVERRDQKMPSTVPGPAAQTIDIYYAAKLEICQQWDESFGLSENHLYSAVRALKACYAARRPFFVLADNIIRHA